MHQRSIKPGLAIPVRVKNNNIMPRLEQQNRPVAFMGLRKSLDETYREGPLNIIPSCVNQSESCNMF